MEDKKRRGVPLYNFPLDETDEIAIAMKNVDWKILRNRDDFFDNGFITLQPFRRVFGLLALEEIRNTKGENILAQWIQIPVMQYFTGEDWFHWDLPITINELDVCKSQLTPSGVDTLNLIIKELKQSKYNKT